MNLSVIIPIKDEQDNLRPLHERLCSALDPLGLEHELIFVDDGSTDGSVAVLSELAGRDPRVRVVQLRRNFGQTAALQAGIDHSTGDILVTLDGDLQNDPADIPMLLERLHEGYDAVFGQRAKRQDNFVIRKLPSLAANWLIRWVTGSAIKDMGCTLRAMRRDLAEELSLYGEMHRFVPVLAQQYGAKLLQVPVRHHPRVAGQTKYTLSRSVRVLLDLITVKFFHSYLTRPMHIMGLAGLVALGLGALSLLVPVWNKVFHDISIIRSPMLHLTVMLELIGVQFISMGLLGEVLSRTYFESQGKKAYTVRRTLNLETNQEQRRAA
ncbi:MAG: glycosyltransferase family 2 protein [Planctomycetia bacterium]|nr:glycosyltransferase family 2 protein [Planctomycetia bacterium]